MVENAELKKIEKITLYIISGHSFYENAAGLVAHGVSEAIEGRDELHYVFSDKPPKGLADMLIAETKALIIRQREEYASHIGFKDRWGDRLDCKAYLSLEEIEVPKNHISEGQDDKARYKNRLITNPKEMVTSTIA